MCSASLISPGDIKNHPSYETSEFPNDHWSRDNLPPILFYVIPPKLEKEGVWEGRVKNLLENGQEVDVTGTNRKLRDFDHVLPRKISLNVEGKTSGRMHTQY